ncbi:O-antigen ligase family protein [Sphingomonas pituitosa]|uniref:O-antigen ligase family protein n=1 Tax=Sphingomonas pituitosa TaxID=99597 RepID=UPI00082F106E|nr:O-antigen ligase family protein [Sphingomonas pituitosa]
MAAAVRRLKTILGLGPLNMGAPFRELLRPKRDVLPIYQKERAGWAVAMRRLGLILGIMIVAFVYGVLCAILPPSMLLPLAAPLGLLALLVVWALPEARAAPTRALTYSLSIFLFVMICWPNYLAVSVAGLPWISLRRLVGLIMTLLLLICLSTSKQFRRDMTDVLRSYPLIGRCLIAFFAIQFLSAFLSTALSVTIGRWINLSFTSTAICFVALWVFGPGGKDLKWFTNRLLLAVSVLMVIGVFEARVQHILWVDHIPSFLKIDEETLQQITQPHIRTWYRVLTTYTTALSYGELLALATPFVLWKLVNAKNWPWRLFWAAFDVALLYSALLTTARLAMVGYLVAHALFGLLWGMHRWRNARGDLLGISATMLYPAFLVALGLAVLLVPALHVRVLGGGGTQASNDARHVQFAMSVPLIARRPLLGYGPGQGGSTVNFRTEDNFLTYDLGLVAIALDYGLLGFFSYMGMILLSIFELVRTGLRERVDQYPGELAVASALAVLITTRLVLAQTDNDPLFSILFGLALATLYSGKRLAGWVPAARKGQQGPVLGKA